MNSKNIEVFNQLIKYKLILAEQFCCNKNCKNFNHKIHLRERKCKNEEEGSRLSWRCNKCQRFKSILDSSFFSLFRKPPATIMNLIKCWACELTIKKTQEIMKLNFNDNVCEQIIGKVFQMLRDICSFDLSILYSDCWSAYNKLTEIWEFKHQTVNHSYNFINPDNGIYIFNLF